MAHRLAGKNPNAARLAAKQASDLLAEKRKNQYEAEQFGREVRREHEALGRLLIMLKHVVGMPVVPGVIEEATDAFAAVQTRTLKITAPENSIAHWARR